MTTTLTFEQAVALVEAERKHQDNKWGPLEQRQQTMEGFLLVVEAELAEAKAGWLKNDTRPRSTALEELTQVAATAIACIQMYGAVGNGCRSLE